tara:strand:+ start:50049 stop:50375 length:327 start_codon:yes stop_codon:yes gene_type:complete
MGLDEEDANNRYNALGDNLCVGVLGSKRPAAIRMSAHNLLQNVPLPLYGNDGSKAMDMAIVLKAVSFDTSLSANSRADRSCVLLHDTGTEVYMLASKVRVFINTLLPM